MEKFIEGKNRLNTSCIKWDLQKERIGVDGLLPFWIADSDYETCEEVKKDLIKRVNHGVFGYTIVDQEYKDICRKWFKKRYHYDINNEWIVPVPGVVTSLYFSVQMFTKELDKVVVSTPIYNPFYNVITTSNRTLVCNKLIETKSGDLGTYQLDYDDLDKKLADAKMYIFCNPHNPIGRVWTKEEIDKVVNLCKRHNVVLVSDEIHCDLIMEGVEFNSIGHYFNYYDNIVVCTAPSKTFNIAGLMDSNVIIKNEELRRIYKTKFEEMSLREPNIFGICACKSAYSKGEAWVDLQQKYLNENKNIVYKYFKENIPQALLYKLEGTYLMWINMKFLNLTQNQLFQGLIDEGILINNGTVYSEDYTGYIRFNIACGRKQLYAGLERIKKFVNKYNK